MCIRDSLRNPQTNEASSALLVVETGKEASRAYIAKDFCIRFAADGTVASLQGQQYHVQASQPCSDSTRAPRMVSTMQSLKEADIEAVVTQEQGQIHLDFLTPIFLLIPSLNFLIDVLLSLHLLKELK